MQHSAERNEAPRAFARPTLSDLREERLRQRREQFLERTTRLDPVSPVSPSAAPVANDAQVADASMAGPDHPGAQADDNRDAGPLPATSRLMADLPAGQAPLGIVPVGPSRPTGEERATTAEPPAPKRGPKPKAAQRPAGMTKDSEADSPLLALPGAGPGLVWMLQKAGITSLHDLAQADAAQLRRAMGRIGHLVDVPFWIDCAAKATCAPDVGARSRKAQAPLR